MKDAALAMLVREYQTRPEHGRSLDAYLRFFKNLALPEAIKHAGYRKDGKVHDHQRLVGKEKLGQASQALLRRVDELRSCDSFDELHAFIEQHTQRIERFGVLARYDFSLRIGACRGLRPKAVYLHAGAKEGCKALGVQFNGKTVKMMALAKPVQIMEPYHAENFLCIYKDKFKMKFGRTPRGC